MISDSSLMEKIISLCRRRGFVFPGSEIYGGLANSWDFGPLGVELKNNIKEQWWRWFVRSRNDVVGVDTAIIMNPKVWEASGHLKEFVDLVAECKKCQLRLRADQLRKTNCPACDLKLPVPRRFNLLFKTFVGPAEDSASVAYLRPETAQGMFVDFEKVVEVTRKKIPFGIAQVGKAFRNEITPGNFIFRTREFEQMEIEYFVEAKSWRKHFNHWLTEMKKWLKHLGIKSKNLEYREIAKGERAHYSQKTIDIFYKFPFGWEELYGLAYRGDYDLKNHRQTYRDPETNKQFLPHVIEPTWGVERSVLAALIEAYNEEQAPTAVKGETAVRVVMKFPHWLAPYKAAVLPLLPKPSLAKLARSVHKNLLPHFSCEYDETQSIGRRYRRQDEIGTPFCVTVDFDSLKDKSVTIRGRDTMKQERLPINQLTAFLEDQCKS